MTNWKLFFLKPTDGSLRKLSVVVTLSERRLKTGRASADGAVGGVGLGVVPGGKDVGRLGEDKLVRQVAVVGLGEGGADEVLVAGCGLEGLLLVLHRSL